MEKFDFLDYLNYMDVLLNDTKPANDTRIEISKIREHKANVRTMQKHLRNYQAIKKLMDSGVEMKYG